MVCRAYGDEGDEVLTFTPIYPPFLTAPPRCGKTLRTIPLRRDEGLYTLDVERFEERAIRGPGSCCCAILTTRWAGGTSTGRSSASADICVSHDILICSDEIHCDLILDGGPRVPTAMLGPEVSARTITLMAPSKTFNIPGLNCAFAIIENADVRTKFKKARDRPHTNVLGYTACLAAYRDGEPWRLALIDYLRGNKNILQRICRCGELMGLAMDDVQATYLAWIDVRAFGPAQACSLFEKFGVVLFGREFREKASSG